MRRITTKRSLPSQETYDATPTSYVSALNNGSTVYYAPAGVRLVKQILLQFSEEDQEIIDTLQDLISDKTTEVSTLTTSLNNAISALGTETTLTADDLAAQVSVAMESPKAVEPTAAPEAEETTDAVAAEDAEADTEAAPVTTVSDRPVSTLATVSDLTANFTEEIDESLQEMAKELGYRPGGEGLLRDAAEQRQGERLEASQCQGRGDPGQD